MKTFIFTLVFVVFLMLPLFVALALSIYLYLKAIKYSVDRMTETETSASMYGFSHINYSAPNFTFQPKHQKYSLFNKEHEEYGKLQTPYVEKTYLTEEENMQFNLIIKNSS